MKPSLLLTLTVCTLIIQSCQLTTPAKVDSTSKFNLLIDNLYETSYSTPREKVTKELELNLLLINTSDDTLRYAYSNVSESKFYLTDSKILAIKDKKYLRLIDSINHSKTKEVVQIIIPPRNCTGITLILSFRKKPDSIYSLKIGLHLLDWKSSYNAIPPNDQTITHAPIIWSETETFNERTDSSSLDKNPNERKRRAEIIYHPLTTDQQKNYVLKVDTHSLIKRDSIAYLNSGLRQKVKYISVPLKLSNLSSDTLYYTNMNCEWPFIYSTNDAHIGILQQFCTRNFPEYYEVTPHRDTLYHVPVYYDEAIVKPGTRFKLGMTLLKIDAFHSIGFDVFYEYCPLIKGTPQYTIWSNEVAIPK